MKKIEIKPYSSNDYTIEYKQVTADPNEQNTKIIITYKDGIKKELIHGKDFYTNAAKKEIDIDLPLEFDPKKCNENNIPVILNSDIINLQQKNNIRIVSSEIPNLVVGSPISKSTSNLIINISNSLREELKENGAVSAKITCDYVPKESYLNNVVGIIEGKPFNRKAIVLTAHFDHVGQQGDYLFNGVVDNASGVAALMSTAEKVKNLTRDIQLDYDILIAAVNSEETGTGGFEGSKHLVEYISKNYEAVQNINIDCVGAKKQVPLEMGFTESFCENIIQKFRDKLKESNIEYSDTPYYGSDHISFQKYNYPAFTVGGALSMVESLHSNVLTTDDVDINRIEKLSTVIADGKDLFMEKQSSDKSLVELSDEWEKLMKEELLKQLDGKKLKPNEMVYFVFNNKLILKGADGFFESIDEINKYYPSIKIPEEISDYKFSKAQICNSSINITCIRNLNDLPDDRKMNQPFEVECNMDKVNAINVTYQKDNLRLNYLIQEKKEEENQIIDDSQTIVELNEPPYENCKLISYDKGKTFYSLLFEKDNYEIKFYFSNCFSKEDFIKKIDELDLLNLPSIFKFIYLFILISYCKINNAPNSLLLK